MGLFSASFVSEKVELHLVATIHQPASFMFVQPIIYAFKMKLVLLLMQRLVQTKKLLLRFNNDNEDYYTTQR